MTNTEKIILVVVGFLALQKLAGAKAPAAPNVPPAGGEFPPNCGGPAPIMHPDGSWSCPGDEPITVQPVGVICLDANGVAYTVPTGPCPVMQLPPAGGTGYIPPGLQPPTYFGPIPVV